MRREARAKEKASLKGWLFLSLTARVSVRLWIRR
jgi:hypothetical protein